MRARRATEPSGPPGRGRFRLALAAAFVLVVGGWIVLPVAIFVNDGIVVSSSLAAFGAGSGIVALNARHRARTVARVPHLAPTHFTPPSWWEPYPGEWN